MSQLSFLVDTTTFQRRTNVTGKITLMIEGISFPARDWNDFPIVILGWWTDTVRELCLGRTECDLDFMDGPYSLKVTKTSAAEVQIRPYKGEAAALPRSISLPLVDLISELLGAADRVVDYCGTRGWDGSDIALLRKSVENLRQSFNFRPDVQI